MNIPALHTNLRTLPQHAFHTDVEHMSRPDTKFTDTRFDATISTMSYPQRIKMMIARAPAPPPLRRIVQAERPPMSEETRAMLLYVHTSHATFGTPTSAQTH
jgi:hypothetical protein